MSIGIIQKLIIFIFCVWWWHTFCGHPRSLSVSFLTSFLTDPLNFLEIRTHKIFQAYHIIIFFVLFVPLEKKLTAAALTSHFID